MLTQALSRPVRDAIEEFQRYVVTQYRRRSARWPLARRLIQRIAEQLVRELGCEALVVDPQRAARLLQVELSFQRAQTDYICGGIVPTEGGFKATVFGDPWGTKARFTVAHECGHVFFYFPGYRRPERILPGYSVDGSNRARREEGLCDAFAGGLLLPEQLIRDLAQKELNLDELLGEANRRRVSPETLLRRVLYDMKWWGSGIFYSIRSSGTGLRIQTYRGVRRGNDFAKAPTSGALKAALTGQSQMEIPSAAEGLLRRRYGLSNPDIHISPSTVWVRI
jgi:IrrE N-terminal-like domain